MEFQPVMRLGSPGPLRDRLVAAVIAGDKTATTALRAVYAEERHPLPVVGERRELLDSDERPVATVEVTAVHLMRIGDVSIDLVRAEGAGFDSLAEYRRRHETVWARDVLPTLKHVPAPELDEDTEVVILRFRLVKE